MKESDKGRAKEPVFMAAQLVHLRPIKLNGLGDCTVSGRADGHTGGTGLLLVYVCECVNVSDKSVRVCVCVYLPTWFDD